MATKHRVSTAAPRQTIVRPGGLTLRLDAGQINADDPGQGTPAMVELRLTTHGLATATFECAAAGAELEGGEVQLTVAQAAWLREMSEGVDAWLDHHAAFQRIDWAGR